MSQKGELCDQAIEFNGSGQSKPPSLEVRFVNIMCTVVAFARGCLSLRFDSVNSI